MKQHMSILALALFCLTSGQAAVPESIRAEKSLTLALANHIATTAMATCTAKGYAVAVTVVDRAGSVRAAQRADDAGPHTLPSSQQKAYTSASAKNTTQAMMEGAQANPSAGYLVHIPGFLLLGGGVPIRVGAEVVGAVGVSGAPRGIFDEQCALAALDEVKDQLK